MRGNRLSKPFAVSLIMVGIGVLFWSVCGTMPVKGQTAGERASVVSTSPPLDLPSGLRAELSSPQVRDGSVILVTVKLPPEERTRKQEPRILGKFEEIELPFFPSPDRGEGVYEAVLGIPFNHKPGTASVTVHLGEGEDAKTLQLPFMIVEGNYRTELLTVGSRHINPRKKDRLRIKREAAEVNEIYRKVTPHKYWTGPFLLPIGSPVTSPFGTKRLFNGKMQSFHTGLDFKAPEGTPIYAAAPGVVALAKNLFFSGNTVLLDHGYGVFTLYAHMSKLKVRKGQAVDAHALLGWSGMTGRANGPHLHWGATIHKAKVNPLDLTKVMQ